MYNTLMGGINIRNTFEIAKKKISYKNEGKCRIYSSAAGLFKIRLPLNYSQEHSFF